MCDFRQLTGMSASKKIDFIRVHGIYGIGYFWREDCQRYGTCVLVRLCISIPLVVK